jgi:predicted ATP-dependent endonuclease of OLD family
MNKIKKNKTSIRIIKELEDGLDPHVLAKQILIKGENKRIFIDYVVKIREKGVVYKKTEEEFLKTYIFSGWKLRRFREIEKNLLNSQQKFESYELSTFSSSLGEQKLKRRIRDISRIHINEELQENNLEQEKLKKEMAKALRQLREEQNLNKSKEVD